MSTATDLADAYWAEVYFGMAIDEFRQPALHVISHAGELAGYAGVFSFRRNASCVISCPSTIVARVRVDLRTVSIEKLFDAKFLSRLLPQTTKIIGPAWIGYLDEGSSILAESSADVLTGASLLKRLPELQLDCDAVEWEHSGLGSSNEFMAGYELNGNVVAAAGYRRWGRHLAHIGVITHPAYRGKGLGRRVVREAARHALGQRLVPQYRTLIANAAAMRIAESLQFKKYGESIAVRLPPDHATP
jgi:ribosomal protein S18 acetylase RimI-like enzyme